MKCETCYDVWFGDDGADKKKRWVELKRLSISMEVSRSEGQLKLSSLETKSERTCAEEQYI